MSGSLAMTSALTADIFGRLSVGSIFGTIFVVHQGGAALGSWLGGLLFELTGGYGAAFTIASVQLLVGGGGEPHDRGRDALRAPAPTRRRGALAQRRTSWGSRWWCPGSRRWRSRLSSAGSPTPGCPATLAMVDNVLQGPGATPPTRGATCGSGRRPAW